LFDLLGRKCTNPNCLVPGGCTDVRALQFDHINGGGSKLMREMRLNKKNLFVFYARNPDIAIKDLQVLCANCNWIKRFENGECKKKGLILP
jgi:hypothetical protein